jgi:hypothetical protein
MNLSSHCRSIKPQSSDFVTIHHGVLGPVVGIREFV